MSERRKFDALVLEGGSMRCAFTAGVLDVMQVVNYPPFRSYYAVSAGSMALTSFLSGQRKHFYVMAQELVEDSRFISYTSVFSHEGLMNLSYLMRYVSERDPIDITKAIEASRGVSVYMVATDFETGLPRYLSPKANNWLKVVAASSTLPLVTRGRVKMDGDWMFDGGYSDPIPLNRALEDGAQDVLVVRTRPSGELMDVGYIDYLASFWFRDNPKLSNLYANGHVNYNAIVQQLLKKGDGKRTWMELSPRHPLRSDGYRVTAFDVIADYRHGLEVALDWLASEEVYKI